MAKLTNSTIYGSANITGTVVSTGPNFDISAASGINLSASNTINSVVHTNTGSGYISVPAVIFSNTTTGGVTANANAVMRFSGTIVVGNVGSGYANGDILFANVAGALQNAWFTVTSNTATTYGIGGINGFSIGSYGLYFTIPPGSNTVNPYITITGTTSAAGLGANLQSLSGMAVNNVYFSNYGSGYVEQPTITFSGGSPTTSATGYVIVGSNSPKITSLGNGLDFYTPGGQALRLSNTTGAVNFIQLYGAPTGAGPGFTFIGADTNVNGVYGTQGPASSHLFVTGSATQFKIAPTVGAINSLQVTGNTIGGAPVISSIGTDTNISLQLVPKGNGSVIVTSTLAASNVSVTNRYTYVANNVSAAYQFYNATTNSIDVIFG
jgi:hypothetical protein